MKKFSKKMNISLEEHEITLFDALSLDSSSSSPPCLSDIPSFMLRRIMLLDTSSRELPNLSSVNQSHKPASAAANDNPLSGFLVEDEDDGVIHPMDVFLYLFIKSHPIFRQTLVKQVYKCKLSLPLITYDSNSNEVTFNHFAFQTLILSRYVDDENTKSFSAVEEPLPIVSFMRVCECENSQKSEFLNRILKMKHDYFFHKDSNGNSKERFFLNGTVEIAWYLAKWKKSNIINHPYIMLNLRGDACKFSKQRKFLGEISTIVYVFVPFSELTQDVAKYLVEIHDTFKAKVIFLIYKGRPNKTPVQEPFYNILNDKNKTIGLKKKNTCQNLELIENSISQCLNDNKQPLITLTKCIEIATELKISCDTLGEEISSNQKTIDSICKDFGTITNQVSSSAKSLGELKRRLLPLQEKFGDWAEADRCLQQLVNSSMSKFEEYYCNLEKDQLEARSSQVDFLSKPSILLSGILTQCTRISKDKCGFYLFWELLKNYLNSVSREHLPVLYIEYKKWMIESYSVHSTVKDIKKRDDMQKEAKSKLLDTAKRITQSSFGIEHVFREIGQAYEAFHSIHDPQKKALVKTQLKYRPTLLPGIMANLILQGHSFEIVNGDVNHVPIQWVSEVLNCLTELIGADKKIFVISVLGIQSSGKSTLLNTMFGINFPVSSGRCTRGVFMQMIKVKEPLREDLGYDYMVLLDTEGLRAPELSGSLSYKKDNEMATFIVGLGDIALINVKGESHSEMQDILEITVIAFIRMKLTHSKPKCLFVHQNVGDIQAKTNLIIARKSLIDTLNEMTLCAAKQENKDLQFSQFCDVIEFNPEDDVYYFPGLFEGEPPMTSISSGYVENAEKLRTKLTTCCSHQNRSFLTMKQWKRKLSNLWKSVLNENFVFSYRNMLEVNCRVELDISLCSWYSDFAQKMAAIKSEYFNQLSNVEIHQVKDKLDIILTDLFDSTQNLSLDTEKLIMDSYFVRSQHKECLQQWNSETKRYFKSCRDREYKKVKEECDTISKVERQKQMIDENFASYRKEIVTKVRNLYEDKKASFGSEDSVQSFFDEIWKEWKSQIQIPVVGCVNIPRDLRQILLEIPHLQHLDVIAEKKYLIQDLTKYEVFGNSVFEEMAQVYGEDHADYNYYEIINLQTHRTTLGKKVKNFFRAAISPFSKEDKSTTTEERELKNFRSIIQNLDNQITTIIEQFPTNSNYCIDYFQVIIDQSVKAISEYNKTEKSSARESLILTNHFIFDFVFHQCCKAIEKFELLQEKYLEQNSLEIKLFHLENILNGSFSQLCAGIQSEDLCARLLMQITLDGMKRYLNDTILQLLHQLFVSDPEHDTLYTSRASLQLAVLKELAKKKDFQSYLRYIRFPFDYINSFIQRNIIEYSQKQTVLSNLMINLDVKMQDLMAQFIEASRFYPSEEGISSWVEWKQHYHNSIANNVRGVKLSDLEILDIHAVTNYRQFSDLFKEIIEDSCKKFDWQKWVQEILAKSSFTKLQESITDSLIECKALCPFCREPCQLTAGEHEHYCGSFHRPQGITEWRDFYSKKIVIEECTKSVRINQKFVYKDTWYNYSDYRSVDDIFKAWNILGQDSIDSKYWQWVLFLFQDDFVNCYGIVRNDKIDQNWSHLTEEEVIDDIEKHYQNYIFKTTNLT